jgi:NAD(P)-dependent dehydrogenase (short-subunit alcohol dehydrogenase family)
MDLVDRTVVVTGGARGPGLAAAQLFLQRGARIVIGALHSSLASAVSTLDGDGRVAAVASDISTVAGCRAVAPAVASDAGLVGVRGGCSAYGAAKAGIVNLTKQLALDLAPDVRVNCIAPGFIATKKLMARADSDAVIKSLSQITPLQRLGTPAEVADAAVYAAESDFMTGAIISLDGGITSGY